MQKNKRVLIGGIKTLVLRRKTPNNTVLKKPFKNHCF